MPAGTGSSAAEDVLGNRAANACEIRTVPPQEHPESALRVRQQCFDLRHL